MTEKEFKLSDKREELTTVEKLSMNIPLDTKEYIYYKEKWVKEFIKRLKEELDFDDYYSAQIDKLAGDDLVK